MGSRNLISETGSESFFFWSLGGDLCHGFEHVFIGAQNPFFLSLEYMGGHVLCMVYISKTRACQTVRSPFSTTTPPLWRTSVVRFLVCCTLLRKTGFQIHLRTQPTLQRLSNVLFFRLAVPFHHMQEKRTNVRDQKISQYFIFFSQPVNFDFSIKRHPFFLRSTPVPTSSTATTETSPWSRSARQSQRYPWTASARRTQVRSISQKKISFLKF